MVLSQPDIKAAVEKERIRFTPELEPDQWGEASIDLRLGYTFTTFKAQKDLQGITISVAKGLQTLGKLNIWDTTDLRETAHQKSFKLEPQAFVLAMTYERIVVPDDMIALVEGRSTYARVGLSMHQTAPWIQPGWDGPIVLEIMNSGPINIELTPVIDRPCQLSFFQLSQPVPTAELYGARKTDVYQGQQHPLQHKK